ncbi:MULTISPECIES: Flp family type IVb pilin [Arthrobacter]|uniref:Flp family type IVb pilin n=1 Tax=Arthrobacter TaxID=1663 RepID=UPI001F306D27|nr:MULTISPECIES: Flp family type IVb pilin [Arthrobacter]MDP9985285.1 pilus assembly protein Flp/PilA [Arthrobacter oryzae]UKA74317.1 Flp family type IVb pilin [Arthrobacter sp. FW306-07-I]
MTSLMVSMTAFIAGIADRFKTEEKGATAVEYGLMVALIVIAAILGITAVGGQLQALFADIATRL